MPKLKKKSAAQKAREARNRRLTARADAELLQRERARVSSAVHVAREDPAFVERESVARQDPAVQRRKALTHQSARDDPQIRIPEKMKDAVSRRTAREDPQIRIPEKQKDAASRRTAREDPQIRIPEKQKDAASRRTAREDPQIRIPEKQKDAASRRTAREDPEFRTSEQIRDTKATRQRRELGKSSYKKLSDKFKEHIKFSPSFMCSCCGQLWYKESTTATSDIVLQSKGCTKEMISLVLFANQDQHLLCGTCKKSISRKRVPKLSLTNGFDFSPIPDEIKGLSPLEERLVSLRLPFMQIRLMGSERQSSLRGNVVNVENDLDICAQVLPRKFDQTSTVQVQLMRRMSYRSPYMYETIRPYKVHQAAKVLVNSELYISENVALSEDWRLHEEGDTLNFITNEDDPPPTHDKDTSDGDDEDTATFDNFPNLGAEETLIYRENDPSLLGIRIAPGEGSIPLALHTDLNAEVLSFPTIYGGVGRKFKKNIKVSYTDIAKSELRRYDRRACRPTKVLYAFKRSFNEKVYQAMQVCLRKKIGKSTVTAAKIRTPGFIESLMQKDEGYAVFKNLRSSPAYWKEKTKKVLAMVRQLGKCTFFITLSAAETKWTELLVMLMKIVKNKEITEDEAKALSFEDRAELIRSDPVTCMRHFEHRQRALLNLIMKPAAGMFAPFKLNDYFTRLEFQMRGSPHSHGLYWIQDSPVYNESDASSIAECVKFIDEFITCARSEDGEMEHLIGYQIHKHSHTCKKKLKRGQTCRFGFPKAPMKRTMILDSLPADTPILERKRITELFTKLQDKLNQMGRGFKEDIFYDEFLSSMNITPSDYIMAIRSSLKRTTVVLRRSTNAAFVNGYNRNLLEAWGANIDVQFVLDPYACAKYCVGYILKSDGGVSRLLQAATKDVRRGNLTVKDKLKKFANILINGSEISAQEAAAFLLGIPNTLCSRQDVFINTAHPDDRIGMLKSKEELEDLDEDSQEVCSRGLLDYYAVRPEELEDVCLAEFASLYEVKCRKKTRSQKREHTVNDTIEDEFKNSADHEVEAEPLSASKCLTLTDFSGFEDPPNYFREQLMLFVPWRDEEEELLSIDPIRESKLFESVILRNSKPFYYNRDVDDEVLRDLLNEVEAADIDIEDETSRTIENEMNLMQEDAYFEQDTVEAAVSGSKRIEQFLPPRLVDDVEYNKVMRSLNEKQRRFTLNTLHMTKTSSVPFHSFLSGGAGVGKSHVVTAIVQSYLRYHARIPTTQPDEICVLVAAPTGKAAFNVFGMTLHCTFKLPPNQCGGKLTNLDDGALSTLRMQLGKVKLFIIDEISMVSVRQLYDIDQRLRQIFGTSEDFGGRSVIVVGHLRQLPPIAGAYVFKAPKHISLGDCVGNYLWEKFFLFELDEIMRQKGEIEFCKALNNMAEGCMDSQDISLIKSCEVNSLNVPPENAIRLFGTNEECREYNATVHQKLKTEGALSTAYDKVQGCGSELQKKNLLEYAKNLNPQQSDGLPYETHLQVDGEYFVSTNVDVQDGLFNGSTGALKMIEYLRTHNMQLIPRRAWMDFRHPLIGVTKRLNTKAEQIRKKINTDWVAIDRINRNLSKTGRHHGLEIIRTQIPLVAANGMTIAKSQGSSLPFVVVSVNRFRNRAGNLTRKLTRESLYVACSRATSKKGLFIDGDFQAPTCPPADDPVSIEIGRLRNQPFPFKLKFLQDYNEDFVKLYFHNVQSFVAHSRDVVADNCAMASDIIAFVEPHLQHGDQLDLPEFMIIHRSDCRKLRNSEGALMFLKSEMSIEYDTPAVLVNYSSTGHCLILTSQIDNQKLRNQIDDVIVIGDINIDLQKPQGKKILEFFADASIDSKLDISHSTTDGGSHIDICFSNVKGIQSWIYESYFSYHKPICVVWPRKCK